jgi:dephospho-CoA kinase
MKELRPEFCRLNPASRLYALKVPIIGLTGGIASGKSAVASLMKKRDIPLIDADQLVKQIYELAETKDFIAGLVPEAVIDQKIAFPKLREAFFKRQEIKLQVENWVYALLPARFQLAYQALGNPAYVVYDVPLLFEKNLQHMVDLTVLVYASRQTQKERLMRRDSITAELSESILDQQMDIERKRELAELVIENEGPQERLDALIESLLRQLLVD